MVCSEMPYINASEIASGLSYSDMVLALKRAYVMQSGLPERHHYQIGQEWGIDAQLLIMPAWRPDKYMGVKLISLYPDNPAKCLPNISGLYCLFDGEGGQILATFDAAEITARRTAAKSVLASCYFVKDQFETLLVVGTGKLAAYFIRAYAEVLNPQKILLWGRNQDNAEKIVSELITDIPMLSVATDLEHAAGEADVISTLTTSKEPIIIGKWCKKNCHLDLVGAYRPDMREVDDDAINRASIFVDSFQGALKEAGDIIQPLEQGIISRKDVRAELAELIREDVAPGLYGKDMTIFISVGSAIEDLAAAVQIYEKKYRTMA